MINFPNSRLPMRPKSKQKYQTFFEDEEGENQRPDNLTYSESLMKIKPQKKRFLIQESTDFGPWSPQAENILAQTGEKANQNKRKSQMPSSMLAQDSVNNTLSNRIEPSNEIVDGQIYVDSAIDDPQLTVYEVSAQRSKIKDELAAKTNLRVALVNFPKRIGGVDRKFPFSSRVVSIEEETEDPETAYTARHIPIRQAPAKFFQQESAFVNSQNPQGPEGMQFRFQKQEPIPSPKFPYLSELIPPQKLTRRAGKNAYEGSRELQSNVSYQKSTISDLKNPKEMPVHPASLERIKKKGSELKPKSFQIQELKSQDQKNITPLNTGLSPAESVIGKGIHFSKQHPVKKPFDEERIGNKDQDRFSIQEGYISDKTVKFRARSANSNKKEHYDLFLPGFKVTATPRKEIPSTFRGELINANSDEIPVAKFNIRKHNQSKIESKSDHRGVAETARDRLAADDPLSNHFTQTYDVASTLRILKKINQNARMLRPPRKSLSVPNRKGK